jgi:carbon-monoxide dehydrogenase iron sulfur subunit
MVNRIEVNTERCTGCRICELICSFTHEMELNPARSRIRVTIDEDMGVNVPVFCHQCEDMRCIHECPNSAITANLEYGTTDISNERCNGCGVCVEVCSRTTAIFLDPIKGTVRTCDFCKGSPQCVKWCPTQALSLKSCSVESRVDVSGPSDGKR